MKRNLLMATVLAIFISLGGCAGLDVKQPTVTLADLDVIEAGLFEQRFACKLRIQNPNDFELPLTGLNFEVEINGQPFAKGVSNKPAIVPRLGEELLEVTAVSTLAGVLRQINEWPVGEDKALTFRIRGRLATGSLGWLSFDESGTLKMPEAGQEEL